MVEETCAWMKEFPAAIVICDAEGRILEMNDKAARTHEQDGGRGLIGSNALDCHPEPARGKMASLLQDGRQNVYTIEKNGIKKMIYQTPWYANGQMSGLIEFSFEIPFDLPHHHDKHEAGE
jgi:transcriptional regulator with PAS, ATPase and Fis domain